MLNRRDSNAEPLLIPGMALATASVPSSFTAPPPRPIRAFLAASLAAVPKSSPLKMYSFAPVRAPAKEGIRSPVIFSTALADFNAGVTRRAPANAEGVRATAPNPGMNPSAETAASAPICKRVGVSPSLSVRIVDGRKNSASADFTGFSSMYFSAEALAERLRANSLASLRISAKFFARIQSENCTSSHSPFSTFCLASSSVMLPSRRNCEKYFFAIGSSV